MKTKYSDITGIILSGGRSSRMGIDKALLKITGQTIIERTYLLMSKVFDKIILSTNDFENYKFLGLPLVRDIHKNHGPISGIHSSLVASSTERNFFLSCDLPLMSEEMIRYIVGINSSMPISVPIEDGKIQPLCGVYNKSLIPTIEKMLNNSAFSKKENGKSSISIMRLIEKVGAEILEVKSCRFFNTDLFFNMNTTEDFNFVKEKISE